MKIKPFFSQEKPAYNHSFDFETRASSPNTDIDLIPDNIIYIDKVMEAGCSNPNEYVNKRFQPLIDEYNDKQKRADRIIKDPYNKYWSQNANLNKGKNQLFYETACGIGDHEQLGRLYYDTALRLNKERKKPEDKQNKMLIRQLEKKKTEYISFFDEIAQRILIEIQKRFPHLEIMYASLHLDEKMGTPHLQFAYLPIGEGYKRGLPTQSNLAKALSCDGVERIEKATTEEYQWKRFFSEMKFEIIAEAAKEAAMHHKELFPDGLEIDYTENKNVHKTKGEWLADTYREKEKGKIDDEMSDYKSSEKEKADADVAEYISKLRAEKKDELISNVKEATEEIDRRMDVYRADREAEIEAEMKEMALKVKRLEKATGEANKKLDDTIDQQSDWSDFLVRTGRAELIAEHREFEKKKLFAKIENSEDVETKVNKADYDDRIKY